jgi:hypothetical protein
MKSDPVTLFRRGVYQSLRPKAGIGEARRQLKVSEIPKVVSWLSSDISFGRYIFEQAFPLSLSDFPYTPRLQKVDSASEFVWCGSVLSLYTLELSQFVEIRDKFDSAFLVSDFSECNRLLDVLEGQLGVSLWLISQRIRLLHSWKGLKAQKDYLEHILDAKELSNIVRVLSWFLGFRCEDSVSLESYRAEIDPMLEINDATLKDYLRYQLFPCDLSSLSDPSRIISFEETMPIVDRYQGFLSMVELVASRGESEAAENNLSLALKCLSSVKDQRLDKVRSLIEDNLNFSAMGNDLVDFDLYTLGKYSEVLESQSNQIELTVRSGLMRGEVFSKGGTFLEDIRYCMAQILLVSDEYDWAKGRLEKIMMTAFSTPLSVMISSFVDRSPSVIYTGKFSNNDALFYLQSSYSAWSIQLLGSKYPSLNLVDRALSSFGESPSLLLHFTRCHEESSNLMPMHRLSMYQGHLHHQDGRYSDSINCYSSARECNNDYVFVRSSIFLFYAMVGNGDFKDAVDLLCSIYFAKPMVMSVLPVEFLVEKCFSDGAMNSYLPLSILVSLCIRRRGSQWDNQLSDIYENILFDFNVELPSGIDWLSTPYGDDYKIYFLRFICVPRIMDDTVAFDDPSGPGKERIKVCKILSSIDCDNEELYVSEVKSILREESVVELVTQVDSMKISVDVEGVIDVSSERMRSLYARFFELLNSPELTVKLENINKILEGLLGDDSLVGSGVSIPPSEKYGLFDSLLTFFMDQFSFNPAYGLNVNISSSIRHGSFEGEVRKSFSSRGLIYPPGCEVSGLRLPGILEPMVSDFDDSDVSEVVGCLSRFSSKIDRLINRYLDDFLRVRSDKYPEGMFDFYCSREELDSFVDGIDPRLTYNDFISYLLSICWSKVDDSLNNIKNELMEVFRVDVNQACDTFVSSVERRVSSEKSIAIIDMMNVAKTEFNAGLVGVASWFSLPSEHNLEPVDLDLVLGVAINQVGCFYPESRLDISSNIGVLSKFKGKDLSSAVELFYIPLQNVAQHSGLDDVVVQVDVSSSDCEKLVIVSIKSEVAEGVDVEGLGERIKRSQDKFSCESSVLLAGEEKGSGFNKLGRLLRHDFKCSGDLSLSVGDGYFIFCLSFDAEVLV